jgi:acetyltransferase-like isoleucine patch superfamily enzyme
MTVHVGAEVAEDVVLGDGTTVWPLAQIREGARLGAGCIVGRGAYIGSGVVMGDNCKLQNYALVYEPAVLEDGVFVGPAAVFTNDYYPRAIAPDGSLKRGADWEPVGVTVRRGASVGARAVCVAPVTIGRWAMVAAGSVVTKDVADFFWSQGCLLDTSAGSAKRVSHWKTMAVEPGDAPRQGSGSSRPMVF